MPELPEVEVVRRSLEEIFTLRPVIEKITWNRPDLRFPLPVTDFRRWKGARFVQILRRAKYLLLEGDKGSLVCHLGMTGSFRLRALQEARRTHDHVEFWLASGEVLVFEDPRRFGFFLSWPGHWDQVTREVLGVEPLLPEWSADYLKEQVSKRRTPIKSILMDQKVVVGIGNIYASEILFRAGVRPKRAGNKVTRTECLRIVKISRKVLLDAIRHGGSSIRDFHSPQQGEGNFQHSHLVYDRAKEPCSKCRTLIRRTVIGGRSTFWCPRCQT